ncbi:MAG: hypothetical protein ACFB4I_13400 [Cyanophyceae cyanobacterium]
MDSGIIYVATGKKYCAEANISAESVRSVMPDIPITIFTDNRDEIKSNFFGAIEIIEEPSFSFFDKIKPLAQSPYRKTLFLDTDTFVLEPVYELFQVLDRFELTYCQAPGRGFDNPKLLAECPLAFVEPNTGVMSYLNNSRINKLFYEWFDYYRTLLAEVPRKITHDQPALRKVLYDSNIRALVLPPEYNFRTVYPAFKGKMPVKILHGREPTLSRATKILKRQTKPGIAVYDFRDPKWVKAWRANIARNQKRIERLMQKIFA